MVAKNLKVPLLEVSRPGRPGTSNLILQDSVHIPMTFHLIILQENWAQTPDQWHNAKMMFKIYRNFSLRRRLYYLILNKNILTIYSMS